VDCTEERANAPRMPCVIPSDVPGSSLPSAGAGLGWDVPRFASQDPADIWVCVFLLTSLHFDIQQLLGYGMCALG